MIHGLSKAINQYLAPLLSLTSLLLILFAYLSPVIMLQTRVALLTVTPSVSLTQPTGNTSGVDGPSVFLGALGKLNLPMSLSIMLRLFVQAHVSGPRIMQPRIALFPLFLPSTVRCLTPALHLHLFTIVSASDLSVLPSTAPDLLSAPTATTPVFIAISLAFTIIFFFMFTFTAMRSKLGKLGPFFDRPSVQRYTAWIGLFGFMIGEFPPRQYFHS